MNSLLIKFYNNYAFISIIYYGGKSSNWYIGPWAQFEDTDTSEEE